MIIYAGFIITKKCFFFIKKFFFSEKGYTFAPQNRKVALGV